MAAVVAVVVVALTQVSQAPCIIPGASRWTEALAGEMEGRGEPLFTGGLA